MFVTRLTRCRHDCCGKPLIRNELSKRKFRWGMWRHFSRGLTVRVLTHGGGDSVSCNELSEKLSEINGCDRSLIDIDVRPLRNAQVFAIPAVWKHGAGLPVTPVIRNDDSGKFCKQKLRMISTSVRGALVQPIWEAPRRVAAVPEDAKKITFKEKLKTGNNGHTKKHTRRCSRCRSESHAPGRVASSRGGCRAACAAPPA